MSTYNEEILKKYENLPEDVKAALSGMAIDDKINQIVLENKLHVDQAGFLQSSVEQVLIGITHPKEFQDKLVFLMEITPELAKHITEQVNQLIFIPLRQSLQKIHQLREASDFDSTLLGHEVTPPAHEILAAISSPTGTVSPTVPPVTSGPMSAPTMTAAQTVTPPTIQNRIPETPPVKIPIVVVPSPKPSIPVPSPTMAPTPAPAQPAVTLPSIHEEKLGGVVRSAPAVKVEEKLASVSFIPEDHKARINADPYKEKID